MGTKLHLHVYVCFPPFVLLRGKYLDTVFNATRQDLMVHFLINRSITIREPGSSLVESWCQEEQECVFSFIGKMKSQRTGKAGCTSTGVLVSEALCQVFESVCGQPLGWPSVSRAQNTASRGWEGNCWYQGLVFGHKNENLFYKMCWGGEFPGGLAIKDLALSLLWLRLLLWHRFDLWPRNLRMLQACPATKNKKTNKKKPVFFNYKKWKIYGKEAKEQDYPCA